MSLHIKRFVDRVRTAESKGTAQLVLTLQEARDLQADITRLLLDLEESRERSREIQPDIVKIDMDGGKF